METYHYEVVINKPAQLVWKIMLDVETYQQWASAFSPHSTFRGLWQQDALIDFIDVYKGGTRALITTLIPAKKVVLKHIGVLDQDGHEDNGSEFAEQWIGTVESYELTEVDETTKLHVVMETDREFKKMCENSWPRALSLLKKLCES